MQLRAENGMRIRFPKGPTNLPPGVFKAVMRNVEKPHKRYIHINPPPRKAS